MPNPAESAKPPSPVQIRAAPPFFRAKSIVRVLGGRTRTLSNWTTVDYSPQPPAANSRRKPLLQRALLVRAVDKGRGPRTSIIRCSARNELPDRHTPRGLPGSPRYATIRPCDVGATIRRRWNSVRRWTDGSASCHGSACSCWRACSRYRPVQGDRAVLWFTPALLLPAALPLWLLRTTDYTITDTHLRIRCGPLRWSVPLADVRAIGPTRNALSSPALSLDRLRIEYSHSLAVLVSPDDKEGFLGALRTRAPGLARVSPVVRSLG